MIILINVNNTYIGTIPGGQAEWIFSPERNMKKKTKITVEYDKGQKQTLQVLEFENDGKVDGTLAAIVSLLIKAWPEVTDHV